MAVSFPAWSRLRKHCQCSSSLEKTNRGELKEDEKEWSRVKQNSLAKLSIIVQQVMISPHSAMHSGVGFFCIATVREEMVSVQVLRSVEVRSLRPRASGGSTPRQCSP